MRPDDGNADRAKRAAGAVEPKGKDLRRIAPTVELVEVVRWMT
jgi:hypothetical protein